MLMTCIINSCQQHLNSSQLSKADNNIWILTDMARQSDRYFGVPLEEITQREKREVPSLVVSVALFIYQQGIDVEGIFRVNGNSKGLEKLRSSYDRNGSADLRSCADMMTVGAVLKVFLRELPDGLIPQYFTPQFVAAQDICLRDPQECLNTMRQLLRKLPKSNYATLKFIISFLVCVTHEEEVNKMNAMALAIVFGPILFRCSPGFEGLKEQGVTNYVTLTFIMKYDTLFLEPDEISPHSTQFVLADVCKSCKQQSSAKGFSSDDNDSICSPHSLTSPHPLDSEHGDANVTDAFHFSAVNSLLLKAIRCAIRKHVFAEDVSDEESDPDGDDSNSTLGYNDRVDNDTSDDPRIETIDATSTQPAVVHSLKRSASDQGLTPPVVQALADRSGFLVPPSSTDVSHSVSSVAPPLPPRMKNTAPSQPVVVENSESSSEESDSDSDVSPQQTAHRNQEADADSDVVFKRQPANRRLAGRRKQSPTKSPTKGKNLASASKSESHPKTAHPVRPDKPMVSTADNARPAESTGRMSTQQRGKLSTVSESNMHSVPSGQPGQQTSDEHAIARQLNRQIQVAKKRIKEFEIKFEEEHGVKPSKSDKAANPEIKKCMAELSSARRQLSELHGATEQLSPTHDIHIQPPAPLSMEGTLVVLLRKLTEKRKEGNRPEDLSRMTREQIKDEKVCMQKALLHFETLHGRPSTGKDKELMHPLYDRYRQIKRILARHSSSEEEEADNAENNAVVGAFGDGATATQNTSFISSCTHNTWKTNGTVEASRVLPSSSRDTLKSVTSDGSHRHHDDDNDFDEDMMVSSHGINLSQLSTSDLEAEVQRTLVIKKRLQIELHNFEQSFVMKFGRRLQRADRMAKESDYRQYKIVKGKLKLLEALLMKREGTKRSPQNGN